jgi:hypothetical protein
VNPISKILVVLLCVCLVTTAFYLYITSERLQNDTDNTDKNEKPFTAIQSLNISKNYMDANYENYNLSSMYQYNEKRWVHTYIINNDTLVTYINLYVMSNGSVSSYFNQVEDVQTWYYPWDTRGFDSCLLKIDNDIAERIIKNHINNETEYNSSIELKLPIESRSMPPAERFWIIILHLSQKHITTWVTLQACLTEHISRHLKDLILPKFI